MSETVLGAVSRRHLLATAAVTAATGVGATVLPAPAAAGRQPVNDDDIMAAIQLACGTMQSVFNADDNDIPWFGHHVVPYAQAESRFLFSPEFQETHVPGRHLNALLSARDLGARVDYAAIAKHRDAAYLSLSREVPLPQGRRSPEHPRGTLFLPHNVREAMHALFALYRWSPPDASGARERMERMIAAINQFWTPRRAWDRSALVAAQPDIELAEWAGPFISGMARAVGPLTKYWNATRERGAESIPARDLLGVLRDKAMEHFGPTGVGIDTGGHTHSITCALSGLALLAESTGDTELMDRVWAYWQVGLTDMRDEIGWSIENLGDNTDRGEVNNSGDILETALILGRNGHPSLLNDADRFIRAHILPSQLVDTGFIKSPQRPYADSVRDVARRSKGAFGFPAPYGHWPQWHYAISFNLDIVGGATASLCEAYRQVTRRDGQVLTVQLWFDADTPHATVRSPYRNGGVLRVTPKQAGDIRIPLPSWTDRSAVRVDGHRRPTFDADGALVVSGAPARRPVQVTIPLPQREIDLGHRSSGIRVRLRGDEVASMESFGQDLTFFPPVPARPLPSRAKGLVARWSFDRPDNPVPDGSGAGHAATVYGSGRIGSDEGLPALLLDGRGFATAGNPTGLNFARRDFSVSLRFRTQMTNIGRLISKGSYGWTPGYFISVGHGGAGHIGVGVGAGQRPGAVGSVEMWSREGGFNDNRWHHVVLVVDRAGEWIRLYVDGSLRPVEQRLNTLGLAGDSGLRLPPDAPAVASSMNALTLGCHLGWGEMFVGAIADVRLYDNALGQAEVAALA